jgi:hypothetical protein
VAKKRTGTGKKAPAGKKAAAKKAVAPHPMSGPPPIPPGQLAFEEYKDTRQSPREEEVKAQRPMPGRFHPARGDVGGRG